MGKLKAFLLKRTSSQRKNKTDEEAMPKMNYKIIQNLHLIYIYHLEYVYIV